MRVLHVVAYFPPDRIGGVGEVVSHLHRGLLAEGHDSQVLSSGTTRDDERVVRVGRTPGRFVLACIRAWRHATGVDVLHAHHGEGLLFLAVTRLRRSRPRILLTLHVDNRALGRAHRPVQVAGHRIGGGWRARVQRWFNSPLKALLDRAAMRLADEVTFISRSAAADVLGPDRARGATVIYNGLPPVATAQPDSSPVEPTELLYVGTAGLRKRTDLLPLILESVRVSIPGARLRIVGFNLDAQPVLKQRFGRSLEAVICEGPVNSDQLAGFYRSAGVLVVPSAYEGLPMVIMEAFRDGLPVVATDVGGNAEIIEDGVNGFLVLVDDCEAMAKRCVDVVGTRDLRATMGAAARATFPKFTLARQLAEWDGVYRRVLGTGRT